MTNKDRFAATYAASFVEAYPQLPADRCKELIEKATKVALENIRVVTISTPGFKLTAKKLGIKCTYKAFEEFLNA
jgi:hypothetical protein